MHAQSWKLLLILPLFPSFANSDCDPAHPIDTPIYEECIKGHRNQYLASDQVKNCLNSEVTSPSDCLEPGWGAIYESLVQDCTNLALIPGCGHNDTPVPPKPPAPTPSPPPAPSPKPVINPDPVNPPAPPQPNVDVGDNSRAQAEAASAISSCQQSLSRTQTCCANPYTCASASQQTKLNMIKQKVSNEPMAGQALGDYCDQLEKLSDDSGDYNTTMGSICLANSCSHTCQALAQQIQAKVDSCGNCSALSVYENALSQLNSMVGSCGQAEAQANQWGTQSFASVTPQAAGGICANRLGYNPQSGRTGSQAATKKPNAQSNFKQEDCAQNPNLAGCQQSLANPNQNQMLSTSPAASTDSSNFNVPSMASFDENGPQLDSQIEASQRSTANMVPNSENGNRSAFASSGTSASLSKRATASNGSSNKANVESGTRAGGYAQPIDGSGFEMSIIPKGNFKEKDPSWKGFSLLEYFKKWRGPQDDSSEEIPGRNHDKKRRESSQNLLGHGTEVFMEALSESAKDKPVVFFILVAIAAVVSISLGWIFWIAKGAHEEHGRRFAQRRAGKDRRNQSTAPREPHLERRSNTSDRRTRDQRSGEDRRSVDNHDRRSQKSEENVVVKTDRRVSKNTLHLSPKERRKTG